MKRYKWILRLTGSLYVMLSSAFVMILMIFREDLFEKFSTDAGVLTMIFFIVIGVGVLSMFCVLYCRNRAIQEISQS